MGNDMLCEVCGASAADPCKRDNRSVECGWPDWSRPSVARLNETRERVTEWASIETAPRDGTSVLLWAVDHGPIVIAAWNKRRKDWKCIREGAFLAKEPTHWMHLPVGLSIAVP